VIHSRPISRSLLGVLLVAAAVLSAPSASADDEAVTRFQRGVQLYEAENYDGALVEWSTAYKLSKNFKLLYNIGICQTAQKDYTAATESFTSYLAEGGSAITPARRTEVEERLAKLALMVTRVKVTTDAPAGSTLLVDDRPIGTVPLPESITVKIGRRQFVISAHGKTVSKTVEVASGDQNPLIGLWLHDVVPPQAGGERPVDKPVPPPPPRAEETTAFPWALWGLTVVLGGGAVATGLLAIESRNEFEEKQATFGASRAAMQSDLDRAETFGFVTDALVVGAALAGGLSTYFTVRHLSAKKKPGTSARSDVLVSPAGIGYTRSF
jgi:hypothetical protein